MSRKEFLQIGLGAFLLSVLSLPARAEITSPKPKNEGDYPDKDVRIEFIFKVSKKKPA